MGDIVKCSLGSPSDYYNEDLLYKMFGINAELLIDHAWGFEPCTIADIKAYKPNTNSVGAGQVLHIAYSFEKAKLILREMADQLVLDLVDKGLVTDQIVITIGYDIENLINPELKNSYKGEIVTDHYGRAVPKSAHGSVNIGKHTSSTKLILEAVLDLYEKIVNKNLLIRRINITANHVLNFSSTPKTQYYEQLDLFSDYVDLEKEKKLQEAMLIIKKKHGKNAVLKGMNLQEGATAKDRNKQIGGHKA